MLSAYLQAQYQAFVSGFDGTKLLMANQSTPLATKMAVVPPMRPGAVHARRPERPHLAGPPADQALLVAQSPHEQRGTQHGSAPQVQAAQAEWLPAAAACRAAWLPAAVAVRAARAAQAAALPAHEELDGRARRGEARRGEARLVGRRLPSPVSRLPSWRRGANERTLSGIEVVCCSWSRLFASKSRSRTVSGNTSSRRR